MAEKKEQKYFDCKTCRSKLKILGVDICSLRIKKIDEYKTPTELSWCDNIKQCDWYRNDNKTT